MQDDDVAEDNWRALLTGDDRSNAEAFIGDIARALTEKPQPTAGIASGHLGSALFFYYRYLAFEDDNDGAIAQQLFELAASSTNQLHGAGLYSGLTGLGFAMIHALGDEHEESLEPLDETVLEWLGQRDDYPDFDVIGGWAGVGLYALERWPHPTAKRIADAVVERLRDHSEPSDGGITFRTHPRTFAGPHGPIEVRDKLDLGVAHGVPGVLYFLARYAELSGDETARQLAEGAATFVRAHQLPDDAPSCYATEVGFTEPSRVAWCYGDPGVGLAFIAAGQSLSRPDLVEHGREVLIKAAGRRGDDALIFDVGICHGAAGIGHLFNRGYQATGAEELADAARFWLRAALQMRSKNGEAAGVTSYDPALPDGERHQPDAGFLSGAAGVGLVMLAAISDEEPSWDRVLCAEVAPLDDASS